MDPVDLFARAALIVVTTGFGLYVRRLAFPDESRKSSRSPEVWRRVAEELGLTWHTDGDRASGWIGDDHVRVDALDHRTRVSFALWPPLDFGLDANISDADAPSVVEYPDWLMAGCPERERLREFFTPRLRAALENPSLGDLGARVVVGDDAFRVVCEDVIQPKDLRSLVNGAIAIAGAIRAARGDVPASYRLSPLVQAWDEQVGSRGFVRERTPVGLARDFGNLHLRCFVRFRQRKRFVVACAGLTRKQKFGIFASSGKFASLPSPWGMRDHSTHDRAFDAAFSVSALSQADVDRWLPEPARRALCEVARAWPDLVVDDHGVSIEVPLDDDEFRIEPLIDAARQIGEELQPSTPPSQRAYR